MKKNVFFLAFLFPSFAFALNFYGYHHTESPHTVLQDEELLMCHAGGGDVIFDLPKAGDFPGRVLEFKRTDGSPYVCQVVAFGTEAVERHKTLSLPSYGSLRIFSDGTNWYQIQ